MNAKLLSLSLGAALVTAGCTLAPRYARPAAPVPAQWPADGATAVLISNSPAPANLAWCDFFPDEKLRNLIGVALTNNRTLRAAILNVEQARAMYGIQRATLLPTIDATGAFSRQRVPADVAGADHAVISKEYQANLGAAAWEIDFFGRIRSLKDEAMETYLAAAQSRRAAQIVLVSSTADAYLTFAADSENLALAETTLTAQQESYRRVKHRHDLGLVNDLDLNRAQTQVDVASGDTARYRQAVALDKNALDLLAGVPVPTNWLPVSLSAVVPPPEISAGVPSDVLLQRPDIAAAEHQLLAANADIGAARAAFFPRISLTAAIGTASSDLSGLFKAGQGAWAYAPQLVLPIFDARTWSAHQAAKANEKIAVAQYELAIQRGFRDVADALAVHGTVDQQLTAQESLVHASSETFRLSDSRYQKGIDGYLSVLDAQRSLYAAQQGLVSLRLAKLANQVQLYSVLGGGWLSSPGSTLAAQAPRESSTKNH